MSVSAGRYRAALPMYDFPETRVETDAEWAAVRRRLPGEIDVRFERPDSAAELAALLADTRLLLCQVCWGPIRAGLLPPLTVLAQPDYSAFPGGSGALYRSAVVAAGAGTDTAPPEHLGPALQAVPRSSARLAFNERHSLSGHVALAEDMGGSFDVEIETGSHRASLRAVAEGRADLAAIDCRSLAILRRIEPAAERVRVIGWTGARPGLPYVCAPQLPEALKRAVRAALLAGGAWPPNGLAPRGGGA